MTDEQMLTERALDVQRVLCAITRGQKVEIDYAKRVLMMFNQIVGGHPFEKESLIGKVIQSAILAEREACAAYCDQIAGLYAHTGNFPYSSFASAIARDIRAGGDRETENPSNLPQDQSETPSPAIPTPES